jgi:Zn-dependent metalloprotease
MRKQHFLILTILLLIGFISCESDTASEIEIESTNEYCINRILNNPDSIILPEAELSFIKTLFNANHISFNNYQFYSLQKDELGYHHIRCRQFINNLDVFSNVLFFHFDSNGNYSSQSGTIINETLPDPKPSMNEKNVVEKFLSELNKDGFHSNNTEAIKSGCFDCELGYYNLNAGKSFTVNNFARVWKVKSKNREYPYAIINDSNGSVIYYDNGIRY